MAGRKPVPPHVRAAILRGDKEVLRAMGQRGARKSAETRKRRKALAEEMEEAYRREAQERANADERHRRTSANYDICPIDPDEAPEEEE